MGSGKELVDYSRALCLGADQKTRGLWERDWLITRKIMCSRDAIVLLCYFEVFVAAESF